MNATSSEETLLAAVKTVIAGTIGAIVTIFIDRWQAWLDDSVHQSAKNAGGDERQTARRR